MRVLNGCDHEPDPTNIQPARWFPLRRGWPGRGRGTDWLLDVACRKCGRNGTIRINPADIDFGEERRNG